MKKGIATLLVLLSLFTISTVYGQQSNQNTKADCIADAEQIRKLVLNRDMLLQQRNLLIERVNLLQKDIVNYQELVKAKNGEINRLDAEIALDSNIVSTYKSKIATYDLKIASYNRDIEAMRDTYAKEIKSRDVKLHGRRLEDC